jgi:orotate phosphoribosyltransferase
MFHRLKAYWVHSGDPKDPHVELTSGMHSDCYFDSTPILKTTPSMQQYARHLVEDFYVKGGELHVIDKVIGPKTGGETLARFIAAEITRRRNRPCKWAGPVKVYTDGVRHFELPSETRIIWGEHCLLCDDVISTGGSIKLCCDLIKRSNGRILPNVITLVNRTGTELFSIGDYPSLKVSSLITRKASMWKPEECPLCKQGSKAIQQPRKNWTELTA